MATYLTAQGLQTAADRQQAQQRRNRAAARQQARRDTDEVLQAIAQGDPASSHTQAARHELARRGLAVPQ